MCEWFEKGHAALTVVCEMLAALVIPPQDDYNRKTLKADVKPLPRRIENIADDPRYNFFFF